MFDFPSNLYWFLPLGILDIIFKGITLWKTVKKNQKGWFIAILLVNSFGILPIIYLLFFDKNNKEKK